MFHFLSFGCRLETVFAWYKRRPTIETSTTIWYISVLLVSLVYILHICPFPTVFPEICWTFQNRSTVATFWAYKNISKLFVFDVEINQRTLQMHCLCCCITYTYNIYTLCTVEVVCVDMYGYHSTCTSDVYHTSSKQSIVCHRCVPLSLFWMSIGNCVCMVQTTSNHWNLHNDMVY